MGCPEWEDADFHGEFGDQFRPDWSRVNLRGFRRPRWFAQGPRSLCIAFLLARRRGWTIRGEHLWRWLEYASRLRRAPLISRSESLLARELRAVTAPWWYEPSDPRPDDVEHVSLPAVWLRAFRQVWQRGLRQFWYRSGRTLVSVRNLLGVPRMLWSKLQEFYRVVAAHLDYLPTSPPRAPRKKKFANVFCGDVVAEFSKEFPQRPPLEDTDIAAYRAIIGEWRELFLEYDIIHAYSTDPILPFLAAVPYVALEHGTLREIPYQDTATGRLTALAYRRAAHVFVTNADCMESARWLADDRVDFVNHPYDDNHSANVNGAKELRSSMCAKLSSDFLIFFPTRHDWVPGTGYADKANDSFLYAFGRLRAAGFRVGMVCCNWGKNVEESRQLIASLGCAENVRWMEPMGIVQFERTAMASDLVADQFKLGAFGGVTFKALAAGVPVMTYLKPDLFSEKFPMPPVLNCRDEEEIHQQLMFLVENKASLERLARVSKEWVNKYHNADALLKLEIATYARVLGIDATLEPL